MIDNQHCHIFLSFTTSQCNELEFYRICIIKNLCVILNDNNAKAKQYFLVVVITSNNMDL